MFYNIYSIYDKLTDTIGNLWLAVNDDEARERVRVDMLERKVKDPKFNVERFSIMYLGRVEQRVEKNKEGFYTGMIEKKNVITEGKAYLINEIGEFQIPEGAIDKNSEIEGAREKNTIQENIEAMKKENKK